MAVQQRSSSLAGRRSAKAELENALGVYQVKLEEMERAAAQLQVQLDKWQRGLKEWRQWINQAQLKVRSSHPYRENVRPEPTEAARSRPGRRFSEDKRQFHLKEASKLLDEAESFGRYEDTSSSVDVKQTDTKRVSGYHRRSLSQAPGRSLTTAAPLTTQPTAADHSDDSPSDFLRHRPTIPKLKLNENMDKGPWMSGRPTQGETYADDMSS